MKILIIEDEELLAESIKTLLEGKGFEAECVYNGEEGAAYAQTGIYDLLILDVMIPKMNGYEVAKKVRTKAPSSVRTIDTPDIVYEAILKQRKFYQACKSRRKTAFQATA